MAARRPGSSSSVQKALTRKVGPLPVWAWAAAALTVGYVIYRRRSGASSGSPAAPTPDNVRPFSGSGAGGAAGGASGGGSAASNLGDSLLATALGTGSVPVDNVAAAVQTTDAPPLAGMPTAAPSSSAYQGGPLPAWSSGPDAGGTTINGVDYSFQGLNLVAGAGGSAPPPDLSGYSLGGLSLIAGPGGSSPQPAPQIPPPSAEPNPGPYVGVNNTPSNVVTVWDPRGQNGYF